MKGVRVLPHEDAAHVSPRGCAPGYNPGERTGRTHLLRSLMEELGDSSDYPLNPLGMG